MHPGPGRTLIAGPGLGLDLATGCGQAPHPFCPSLGLVAPGMLYSTGARPPWRGAVQIACAPASGPVRPIGGRPSTAVRPLLRRGAGASRREAVASRRGRPAGPAQRERARLPSRGAGNRRGPAGATRRGTGERAHRSPAAAFGCRQGTCQGLQAPARPCLLPGCTVARNRAAACGGAAGPRAALSPCASAAGAFISPPVIRAAAPRAVPANLQRIFITLTAR
jgi:hypothetical protein